jgi:phospholipid/cholesterol/gamma-HCH transport system ATP-binding protein
MTTPIISAEGIWTTFDRAVIHKDLHLQVRRGETVAIIGSSGSGKTTLLKEMLGLIKPCRGTLRVLDSDMSRLTAAKRKEWATHCGVVFQDGALFSALSVFDNVALPVREARWWPEEFLADLVLVTLRTTGIDVKDAHKLPAELSGGMVKRVALARALVLKPELVFMDEPTVGLDPEQRLAVVRLISNLKRVFKLTVVMITHDIDALIALADRVAVLAEQHIIAAAPLTEVVRFEHPFVQHFFEGQTDRCTRPPRGLDTRPHLENPFGAMKSI